jgi:hypothetical protein
MDDIMNNKLAKHLRLMFVCVIMIFGSCCSYESKHDQDRNAVQDSTPDGELLTTSCSRPGLTPRWDAATDNAVTQAMELRRHGMYKHAEDIVLRALTKYPEDELLPSVLGLINVKWN